EGGYRPPQEALRDRPRGRAGAGAGRQPPPPLPIEASRRPAFMDRVRLRAAAVSVLIALSAAVLSASPALDRVRGLSLDVLTALRWRVFGNAHPPAESPAVVIAVHAGAFG